MTKESPSLIMFRTEHISGCNSRLFRPCGTSGSTKKEGAQDVIQSFDVLAFGEWENVLFAEPAAIDREAVAETTKVIIEVDCPVFRHGDEHLITIPQDQARGRLHKSCLSTEQPPYQDRLRL